MSGAAAIGFWNTLWLLLHSSRRRAFARQQRQRELLSNRGGKTDWGPLTAFLSFLFMLVIHGVAAFVVVGAVKAGQRVAVERQGRIVVSASFFEVDSNFDGAPTGYAPADDIRRRNLRDEAEHIAKDYGGDKAGIEHRLRTAIAKSGRAAFVSGDDAAPGLAALPASGKGAGVLGSLILLWWLAMLICQGEGLELDLQRRRHPMWEWLLSHPVTPGAVFFAEMLSPISANPAYWGAPLFAGILYGLVHGPLGGIAAAILVGIPLTIAAACVGKALEIGAVLRLAPRNRGGVIGMLGWFGYASTLGMAVGLTTVAGRILGALAGWIAALPGGSWPLLRLFLGMAPDGNASFAAGLLFCWAASGALAAAAVLFSARSVRNGLAGAFPSDTRPGRPRREARFGRNALLRKEFLWFARDRSAIVQAILIPLSVAGYELFNLRALVAHASDSWNYLVGTAIFFGTFFLWVLGPKSLASEGSALWLALTWPRGLESILKAKARLWSLIASGLVAPILLAACWYFPGDAWKVALVAVGWFLFSRSMAEKSVTLVTVVSESGEPTTISSGRRWAAQLGMLTFAIGVCTEQWNLAIVGIIYSWITAAAMWEDFRARLPFLYDPWSERLPDPPTLVHAMVSITILIECVSLVTATVFAFVGPLGLPVAQGFGYGICAVAVSVGVTHFLVGRGVSPAGIWSWRDQADGEEEDGTSWTRRYLFCGRRDTAWLLAGVVGGALLGLLAQAYLAGLSHLPWLAGPLHAADRAVPPGARTAYAIIAIAFAPFAEEFLFRGLLYRALDRQWGGWQAVVAAAAFFAIYHPVAAWLPVGLLGAANCLLFKRSKRLAPAVLLHMVYNATVTLLT
ncbi:MAG TPA: CPBP family intramembrane glutamic endopeptidase [Allosphingosinicella sp.]|jgi:membrane protease YdiL (CAAX protease family)